MYGIPRANFPQVYYSPPAMSTQAVASAIRFHTHRNLILCLEHDALPLPPVAICRHARAVIGRNLMFLRQIASKNALELDFIRTVISFYGCGFEARSLSPLSRLQPRPSAPCIIPPCRASSPAPLPPASSLPLCHPIPPSSNSLQTCKTPGIGFHTHRNLILCLQLSDGFGNIAACARNQPDAMQ